FFTLFRHSVFGKALCVPTGGFIVADAGYTLLPHVLTPYPIVSNMGEAESHYNLIHPRTRIIVEQCFGLWKNKFRLFKKPLEFQSPQQMALVIEATLVLHNWIIDLDPAATQPDEREWMHLNGDILLPCERYTIDSVVAQSYLKGASLSLIITTKVVQQLGLNRCALFYCQLQFIYRNQ
ncbi:hypothetical protein AaE_013483, partial [Aphanomyces astaci]